MNINETKPILDGKFKLTITDRTTHSLAVKVEEVDESSGAGVRPYIKSAYIKWDGCSSVTFDEGLHLCGAGCWREHMDIMEALWRFAEAELDMDECADSDRYFPRK